MARIVIVGGGLAGGLAALALVRRRPDVEITLVEEGQVIGGNHVWSFFDTDIAAADRWVLEGISSTRWSDHEVRFPRRRRTVPIGYNSIRSSDFGRAVGEALGNARLRLGARAQSIDPTSVLLESGERIDANAVIDARGQTQMAGLDLGWQKFVGRHFRFSEPHGVSRPVIMDATVDQLDGYRFIYQLPFSERELLIEDTYYSSSPLLDDETLLERVSETSAAIGEAEVLGEERGVLPVVLGGDVGSFWRGEPLPRIGARGGFFHPTTSYSLPDAVANAALLASQSDFDSPVLYELFRGRARQLWAERSFFRLLNRMLFRGTQPTQSYRVLEHFYRLPPAVIARFYAGKLSALDKFRILSGRPPVPIGQALSALRTRSA